MFVDDRGVAYCEACDASSEDTFVYVDSGLCVYCLTDQLYDGG